MNDFFLLLFLITFLGLVVGLIRPQTALWFLKVKTRGRVTAIYGLATFTFFVLFGLTAPPEPGIKTDNPQPLTESGSPVTGEAKFTQDKDQPLTSQVVDVEGMIEYRVKANGYFDVTYTNESGGISQTKGDREWKYSFKPDDYIIISLIGQVHREDGDITVEIYHSGKLIKQSHSNGDFVAAAADAAL